VTRNRFSIVFLPFFLFLGICFCQSRVTGEEWYEEDIRPSTLAGSWYPRSREKLTDTIRGFLSKVKPVNFSGKLKAVIVPHAGYRYSGEIAAHAYRLLKGTQFKRIVLIGPSHRMGFEGVSVNLQSGYETPLGIVPVDLEMCNKIINASPDIRYIKRAHTLEHCIEIQLPFLQTVLEKFRIVPVLIGRYDLDTCRELANVLVRIAGDSKETLFIASSDLSHFHNYKQAKELDHQFIRDVRSLDIGGLHKDLSIGKCEACGRAAVITLLMIAKKIDVNKAVILKYANSGDVTGDMRRVVGYVSAALIKAFDTDPHL